MNKSLKRTKVGKITSALISATTVLYLSGAAVFVPMAASADTVSDLQAQIASLLAQITQLQSQLSTLQGGTTTTCGYTFGADLKMGSTGADVKNLQTVLNSDSATQVAASGVGSKGNESTYFGSLTKSAVIKFQNKYASEVLTPLGLTAGTGYVGSMTRTKLNAMCAGVPTTPTPPGETPTTPSVGTGITISSATQPTASIAVESAARMPFTKVTLTAGSDGDVVVNGITIERTGLAQDAVFAGIVLLDEDGMQLGIEKTLNSDHKATIGEAFTVKAGQSRTMTIAGNMAAILDNYAGQVAYISVTGANTTATVSGSLPITGAGHTINATLTIGNVTMARGPIDPGASQTKEVGTTGYTFSSVRATAGSAEKVRVKSIRWNQSGSAAVASDLENVKTYVDGTAYGTTVSSDGKYYTSSFGDGIVIDKGANIEMAIKGDIIGGSARTIDLDIYKRTDLYVVGETYGYGITPPNGSSVATADTGAFSSSNPWYDAYEVTVSAGTLNVQKCTSGTSCEAQNIAINLANQPLGGFVIEAKGESVSVASSVFHFLITSTAGQVADITNITLSDENGTIVAGPVDGSGAAVYGTATFTDTITYTGKKSYYLKGKLGTDFENNQTITASTTPSTDWTTVTGQVTGTSITPSPTSAITANAMTVKAGALAISVSSVPLAQTVIAGASQFLFVNYVLDAGSSGEDVSLSAFPVEYNAGANATKLTSCTLYDTTTALTTGGNIKNPSAAASSTSFTFDTPLTIPKGTTKTVALKCDVAGDATAGNTYAWGYDATGCNPTPIGKISGQAITETETDSAGQSMTVAAGGSYTVVDDSTSGYTIVAGGTTGITLLKLKFSATNESIDITRVNLELGSVASNTPMDLVGRKVTLYDSASPTISIGEAIFSTTDYATSTLIATGAFRIPAGGSKTMLVKGDIAAISGSVGPLTASGDLLIVKYDGDSNGSANGNYGKGVSSGSNITPASSDVTPTGVRIMKTYPTFAKIDLSTTERLLQTKSDATLYKFKMTASSENDVYLYKTTFAVSSSTVTATTSTFGLYAFTDNGYSSADTTFSSDGLLNYGNCFNGLDSTASAVAGKVNGTIVPLEIYMDKTGCNTATTTYKIPKGESRWFELRGTVASVESTTGTEYITVRLEGDAAFPTAQATLMLSAATANNDTSDDLIWSPNSTSTSVSLNDLDYTNGYGVVGLPSTNMSVETLTSAN